MKYKTIGNCPYCDAEIDGNKGRTPMWSLSMITNEIYRKKHEANHPENEGKK